MAPIIEITTPVAYVYMKSLHQVDDWIALHEIYGHWLFKWVAYDCQNMREFQSSNHKMAVR